MIKAKINGIEFECTVEDFKLLVQPQDSKTQQQEKPESDKIFIPAKQAPKEDRIKIFIPKAKKHYKFSHAPTNWSRLSVQKRIELDNSIEHLINNPKSSMVNSFKAVTGKTLGSYSRAMRKRISSSKYSDRVEIIDGWSKKERKKVELTPKRQALLDKNAQRFKFMNPRANYLMRQFNYTREKALSIAAQEFKRGCSLVSSAKGEQKQFQPEYVKTMPTVLDGNSNKFLFDMLRNISEKGGAIKYPQDANILGAYSTPTWRTMVSKIFHHLEAISKYLGIKPSDIIVDFSNCSPVIKIRGKNND